MPLTVTNWGFTTKSGTLILEICWMRAIWSLQQVMIPDTSRDSVGQPSDSTSMRTEG